MITDVINKMDQTAEFVYSNSDKDSYKLFNKSITDWINAQIGFIVGILNQNQLIEARNKYNESMLSIQFKTVKEKNKFLGLLSEIEKLGNAMVRQYEKQ